MKGHQTVTVRVPAKVNLFLSVRARRPDGMHEIVSVMHTVGLFDEVAATLEGRLGTWYHPAARHTMSFTLEHDAGDGLPTDERNLALVAARRLAGEVGVDDPAAASDLAADNRPPASGPSGSGAPAGKSGSGPQTHLRLCKQIPIAAGLGGGSADAAAALMGLNALWGAGMDWDELRAIAETIGADVPFCLTGGTALATGTGVATARVLDRGGYWWIVCISDDPLSTADVYRAWDEVCEPGFAEPDAVLHALRTGDPEALGAALHNDLEDAAFHLRPELADARDELLATGVLGAVLTGSGPTIVGLAEDERHARAVAGAVRRRFDRVEIVSSPAGGPEVIEQRG